MLSGLTASSYSDSDNNSGSNGTTVKTKNHWQHQTTHLIIRNTHLEDIPKIVNLQKESFPYLARYGNIWHTDELESHLHLFQKGQFVAVEPDGTIVGSASTLLVSLNPDYAEHTWKRSLLTECLQIIVLMETAYTAQIYLHIQNIDTKE
jgi:hypothetical protein